MGDDSIVMEDSDFAGYIDDGSVYIAEVMSCGPKVQPWKNDDGSEQKRVEFKFRLISDDTFNGQDLWGSTPHNLTNNEKCKLKQWAEAILGQRLPRGCELRYGDLVHKRCRVVVERTDKIDRTTGEMKTRNKVRDVFATKEAQARLAQATAFDDEPF